MVDYVQYAFNLTAANEMPSKSPDWYKQYSFLNEYNLPKITKDTMGKLFEDLTANDTLAYTYFK